MAEETTTPQSAPSNPEASPLTRFIRKLSDKVEDMTTLTITTAVGSVVWRADGGGRTTTANTKAIVSEIDLIDGDVRTLFDEAFISGDYKELREFHEAREERGHQIVQSNIAALKELLVLVRDIDSET